MPRNTEKYQYYLVGLLRGSALLESLKQEAAALDMEVPTYMQTLLLDRHEAQQGRGQGRWFPRGASLIQEPSYPSSPGTPEEEMLANASKAAGAWEDWDDVPTERMQAVKG